MIAHCCNDLGYWGAGFSGQLSRLYPIAEQQYRLWARTKFLPDNSKSLTSGSFALGEVQFVRVSDELAVANMIGQHGVRRARFSEKPIRYDALEHALKTVASIAKVNEQSVHMPKIGSGLAGGDWAKISVMIHEVFAKAEVRVFAYEIPQPF